MSTTALTALIARCRALSRPRPQTPDAELLRRFAERRDAVAFEELLERYAPLVWGVCRRVLAAEADREDAFQATFLALVHQTGSLDSSRALGGWLHTVAVRVAHKTLSRSRRQYTGMVLPERLTTGDVADEVSSRELFRIVDEEIERLPAALRLPVILCCLEGRTRDEAAELMGCTVAAVKRRLERGRGILRRRLQRRGIQLPAAFLVLALTGERVRAVLWAKAVQLAMHAPSPAVAALAQAGLQTMAAGKMKLALVGLASLLMAASVAGVIGHTLTAKPPETPVQAKASTKPKKAEPPRARADRHGDPLPDGAIARLGTVRWRHGFVVNALAYSPDGKKIAAVGAGRAITLWDAATGKEIHQFPNGDQPDSLAFSPDGKILATGGRVCRLWDVATGKELRQIGSGRIAFSPDGKCVATAIGRSDDNILHLWDSATGKEQRRIDCGSVLVCGLAFSPDGKRIASSNMDGTIHLWDVATGKEHHQLRGHKKGVWKIVFSPDGKRLASSSEDETIRLWDPATGRQVRSIGEKLGVYSSMPIAFSPDSALLASGHIGGIICLWDMATGEEKRRWQAGAMTVRAIAFSPDGKTLASGAVWESIRRWDVATGRERDPSEEHLGFVDFVRFSPDAANLVSISRDHRLLRWDLATRTPHHPFSWPAKSFGVTALSPDGDTLAVSEWTDNAVRLWNLHTGKHGRVLGKHEKRLWALAFSPNGRLVASGGADRVIHVWDVRDGKEVQKIEGFTNEVRCLRFSPDGKALACGTKTPSNASGEPTLRLWDLANGKERCSFDSHVSTYAALAFSPDGKTLATGQGEYGESVVRLWDSATGRELYHHEGHRERITALAFSPDGKLVASGYDNLGMKGNYILVWEAATGQTIRRFEGHHSCIGSVAFSLDGLTVASGAGDSTILLWDITGQRADGRWHTKPPTLGELDACWTALANEDAAKAYDAVWMLVAAPEQSLPFLQKHLHPVPRPDAKIVARLIADLNSDEFMTRQKATEELGKFGDAIVADLRRALEGKPALEVRRRVQQLLDQTRDWNAERLRDHRAIQALEHIGTPKAKQVLETLATGAAEARLTEEAKAAVRRLRSP